MRDDDDANKEGEERRERTSPFELKLTTVYLFVKSYIYIYKYICNVKRERHVDVTLHLPTEERAPASLVLVGEGKKRECWVVVWW
jgi:hypothetical protein